MDFFDLINKPPNEKVYSGVVQNLRKVENNDSMIKKWFNSVAKGVPFPVGKERYAFVIKESNTGVTHGYRAIVYGHEAGVELQEGELCYLTGGTDKNGVIIGRRLYNPKTDTHVEADRVFPCMMTRIASVLGVLMLVYLTNALLRVRITPLSIMGSGLNNIFSLIVLFVLAAVCFKNNNRVAKKLGWFFGALAVYALYPPIVVMVIAFFIIKKVLFR